MIIITNCHNATFHPPIKKPEIIGGVVQGTITPLNKGRMPKYISR